MPPLQNVVRSRSLVSHSRPSFDRPPLSSPPSFSASRRRGGRKKAPRLTPPPPPSKPKQKNRISLAWIVPAYECAKLLRTLPPPAPLPSAPSTTPASSSVPALPPKHPHFSPEQSAAVRRFATLFVSVAAFSALSPVADALLFWLPLYEEIKVAFLAWLLLPGTRGADVLFDKAFVPLLEEHGPALDAAVSRARAAVSAHASEKAGSALRALRSRAGAAVAQLQAAAASAGAASPAKRKA